MSHEHDLPEAIFSEGMNYCYGVEHRMHLDERLPAKYGAEVCGKSSPVVPPAAIGPSPLAVVDSRASPTCTTKNKKTSEHRCGTRITITPAP